MRTLAGNHRRSRGTVLVVALVVLLMLTMLGVGSMRTTAVEERIAGNLRDQHLAFQASESALRAGENFVGVRANREGLIGANDMLNPAAWDGANPIPDGTRDINNGLAIPLAANPVFHAGPAALVRVGVVASDLHFYCTHRVTARAQGLNDTTVSVLQSSTGFFDSRDGDC